MRKRWEWKRKRKYRIALLAVLLCLAVFFLWEGSKFRQEGNGFFQNLTIRAEGMAFDAEWVKETIQQHDILTEKKGAEEGESSESFAAWKELTEESVSISNGGGGSSSDVIVVYGPSHCLLPIGKNLLPEDVEGCIVGSELAEELFGGHQAEGQQLFWRGKKWTVRGVVEEPSHFLMVQGTELADSLAFDRISLACSGQMDAKERGEKFINQYGLSAHVLRFDHRYGWKWLAEMIPSRWSDFDGWKQNLERHQKEVEIVKNMDKSVIEAAGIERYNRGFVCSVAGLLCFAILFWNGIRNKEKP